MQDRATGRAGLEPDLDRGTIAAGFAAAVRPAAATTISMDSEGLAAQEVRISVPDGEVLAYRAMPATGDPFPAILVVHEIVGVHEHIRDICRRLAKEGCYALAPALHAREGDVARMRDVRQILRQVVSRGPDLQVMTDLDATVGFARADDAADAGRLGITGFCWGGRIVWLYAAHNPAVQAGAAWYGELVGNTLERTPRQPVDVAASRTTPVLGLYGGKDLGIPLPPSSR